MRHQVIRSFPGGANGPKVGDVIDTTQAPPRNIKSLEDGRFLERVSDDTPLTVETPAPPAKAGGKGTGGK